MIVISAIDPEKRGIAEFATITDACETALFSARAAAQEGALSIFGAAGHNIDDAVDGIGSPERSAGTANDFDSVDVFHHRGLDIPEDAGKEGRINGATVLQHQEFVSEYIIEAARAD